MRLRWKRIGKSRIILPAMARTIPVLINRAGGTAAAMGETLAAAVEDAFAQAHRAIDLQLLDGDAVAEAARHHAGAPLVVIGGGDGTIGAAAAALAGSASALGVLPLGTRNHFARQLGVPIDLVAAARLAVGGQRRRIDIGLAGGRVFVNNASFGIYTRFVRLRDRSGGPKWLGTFPATWQVLRHMRAQRFALRLDGEPRDLVTPLLFIGNNEYSIALGHLGERESLEDGQLSLCAVAAQHPLRLIGFAARALIGLAHPDRDFAEFASARDIVIEGEGHIQAALDGELIVLPLPLTLRSLPSALGVVTPREGSAAHDPLPARESRML